MTSFMEQDPEYNEERSKGDYRAEKRIDGWTRKPEEREREGEGEYTF